MRFKHLIVCVLYLFFNTAYAKNINPATVEDIVEARIAILTTVAQDIRNAVPTVAVGDYYQGGIVIYIDNTKQHGLILALKDVDDGSVKYSQHSKEFGYANGVGAGLLNSAGQLGHTDDDNDTNAITRLSRDYTPDCTPATGDITAPGASICPGQWYIASLFEWEIVLNNLSTIQDALENNAGVRLAGRYWSSTNLASGDTNHAYTIQFDDATGGANVGTSNVNTGSHLLRGMRQF